MWQPRRARLLKARRFPARFGRPSPLAIVQRTRSRGVQRDYSIHPTTPLQLVLLIPIPSGHSKNSPFPTLNVRSTQKGGPPSSFPRSLPLFPCRREPIPSSLPSNHMSFRAQRSGAEESRCPRVEIPPPCRRGAGTHPSLRCSLPHPYPRPLSPPHDIPLRHSRADGNPFFAPAPPFTLHRQTYRAIIGQTTRKALLSCIHKNQGDAQSKPSKTYWFPFLCRENVAFS